MRAQVTATRLCYLESFEMVLSLIKIEVFFRNQFTVRTQTAVLVWVDVKRLNVKERGGQTYYLFITFFIEASAGIFEHF